MNYITIINRFWENQLTNPVSSGAVALFFYLLNQANIRRWALPISLTNATIQAQMRISKSSFLRYRSELADKGYINYYTIDAILGSGYNINLAEAKKSSVSADTTCGATPDTCGTTPDTTYDTTAATTYATTNAPTDGAGVGLSSYYNKDKEKEKDINIDFKQKRLYNNKKYNDKEIYNSGRYDFERIERKAREDIRAQLRKYQEEEQAKAEQQQEKTME